MAEVPALAEQQRLTVLDRIAARQGELAGEAERAARTERLRQFRGMVEAYSEPSTPRANAITSLLVGSFESVNTAPVAGASADAALSPWRVVAALVVNEAREQCACA